jgi:glyoxylase-like metal-dependent hydrolase (beta-lactamase superfamily II)
MIENVVVGRLAVNCWIIPLNDEHAQDGLQPCIVIDPGADALHIIARLEELRLYPRYILLTHGHFDHTGAVAALLETFHQYEPKLAIHEKDMIRIKTVTPNTFAAKLWTPIPNPSFFLNEGDAIGPFKVLCTPGHTFGSVCFYDESKNLLFSGDTLFANGYGRTDGPGGSFPAMQESLKRLSLLKAETQVFPGHGETTTIAGEFLSQQ